MYTQLDRHKKNQGRREAATYPVPLRSQLPPLCFEAEHRPVRVRHLASGSVVVPQGSAPFECFKLQLCVCQSGKDMTSGWVSKKIRPLLSPRQRVATSVNSKALNTSVGRFGCSCQCRSGHPKVRSCREKFGTQIMASPLT